MRTRTPSITVNICLHNSTPYISETLASALAQTYSDFELLLIDDGSTDGTVDMICGTFHDSRIRILRQPHQGIGSARATACAHARGDYLAFLDHDDLWAADKLERQISTLNGCKSNVALVFTDSLLVGSDGSALGRLGDLYDYASLHQALKDPYRALLTRGCFIDLSSVVARRDAVSHAGGFRSHWRFVEDYDLWLRLARRYEFVCVNEGLVTRRVHSGQFTRQRPDVALLEQTVLLRELMPSRTVPPEVRFALEAYLCGQHRACARRLAQAGRHVAAAQAFLGVLRYPRAAVGRVAGGVNATRLAEPARSAVLAVKAWASSPARGTCRCRHVPPVQAISIDGSALAEPQTGFFNFTVELIRRVAQRMDPDRAVHVVVTKAGVDPLMRSLGDDAGRVKLHVQSDRLPVLSLGAPRSTGSDADTSWTEVVIWRGRFSRQRATRVGVIMDVTTIRHPELHTAHNIEEFQRYAEYVSTQADHIATISENSRRDIIATLPVFPGSVTRMPMSVHPRFILSRYDESVPARYGIATPYFLSVGTLEPRKNLRRLVAAFERIVNHACTRDHVLVLAGPEGWDSGFLEWVRGRSAADRIRVTGMVDATDLPSLYHYAQAFVYPSLYEGFGLPVLEAMYSSSYVVTSSVSSLPEVLGPGGVYVDPTIDETIERALLKSAGRGRSRAGTYRSYCRARAEQLAEQWTAEPPLPGTAALHRALCASHS
jgi:glycosyltransferase involved in cell wall biosynthesis